MGCDFCVVDFLIQRENDIFHVEVKAEVNITSKSLKKFRELFPEAIECVNYCTALS